MTITSKFENKSSIDSKCNCLVFVIKTLEKLAFWH